MTKKEKIIHTALMLFAKHGYTETSINKIATTAGVSKGLTYTHFKDKEDLLKAVIVETLGRMTGDLMQMESLNLPHFLTYYQQMLQEKEELIRLCILLVVHPETPAVVKEMLGKQQEGFLDFLTALLSPFSFQNAALEARILLATLDGITLDYITTPNVELLEKIMAQLAQNYLTK